MKRIIIFATIIAGSLVACNNGTDLSATEEKKNAAVDITKDPAYQPGLDVIGKSDCLTCHKITGEERIQGPTYKEVANKYAGMPDTIVAHLAKKVIAGGSGVWATEFQMTPHPQLTQEEAEAAVKYILLLKK